MASIEKALEKLGKSKFRSSFHLTEKEREYTKEKGLEVIESHARDFIKTRLAPAHIENDGAQTHSHYQPILNPIWSDK